MYHFRTPETDFERFREEGEKDRKTIGVRILDSKSHQNECSLQSGKVFQKFEKNQVRKQAPHREMTKAGRMHLNLDLTFIHITKFEKNLIGFVQKF